eukprot:COSAG06_NODE_860_length_11903_cov_3.097170_3_plen_62_part_00
MGYALLNQFSFDSCPRSGRWPLGRENSVDCGGGQGWDSEAGLVLCLCEGGREGGWVGGWVV